MKEVICKIFGHKWSEKQYIGGDTTRWRRACERCGEMDSDTSTLIEDAKGLLAAANKERKEMEEYIGVGEHNENV